MLVQVVVVVVVMVMLVAMTWTQQPHIPGHFPPLPLTSSMTLLLPILLIFFQVT